ncbi:MAG: Rrf2 family transcriptional regulator [Synergistaceae bacterium]|nr:Rrf2 family transcriptional regulator [Synergistaceae bacterium]
MFLTKECDYAIRVVRGLSYLEIKSVRMVCEHEQVPPTFAYKILKKLEHAGIVDSYRGAVGGYQLAKTLDSITLFDIVKAVDERLFLNECLQEGYICPLNIDGNFCGVHRELTRIQSLLIEALEENTMAKLI